MMNEPQYAPIVPLLDRFASNENVEMIKRTLNKALIYCTENVERRIIRLLTGSQKSITSLTVIRHGTFIRHI